MRGRRGFLLALVLFLAVLLMVMGMGYVGGLVRQYQGTFQASAAAQARALARAGLEDARMKLIKDPQFPPAGGADQLVFSYTEDVTDMNGVGVGCYIVSVDMTYKMVPYQSIRITSTGQAGSRGQGGTPSRILAQDTVVATLDVNPLDGPARFFHYLRWEAQGSY